MKKTIIIPTDFSDGARCAARYAFNIMSGEEVHFILLHSYIIPSTTPDLVMPVGEMVAKEEEKNLAEEQEHLANYLTGETFTLESRLEYGDLVPTIETLCENERIDMVIMGTKGASGMKEVFIGSNTALSIKRLPVPVLAVPDNKDFLPLDELVLASDFKALKRPGILSTLSDLAKKYDANVTILNVIGEGKVNSPDEAIESLRLNNFLAGVHHDYKFIENDDPAEGIEDFVEIEKPDMLVIIPRRLSFFDRIFHKSVTRPLVLHTRVPLLALPDEVYEPAIRE